MLTATIWTAGVAHSADASPQLPRICEPTVGRTVDGKVPPPIIFNRFAGDGRLMRLEGRVDRQNQLIGAKRVVVSDDEVMRLFESGFPVAVLDVEDTPKAANRPKTVVTPLAELPTEFSIINTNYGGYIPWTTYGYFWVPKAMPSGHTFQVVDFTVTPSNFENSGSNSHFAVSALTVSNSNLDSDFDGKGAAIFDGAGACGSANKTSLQSWAIQN